MLAVIFGNEEFLNASTLGYFPQARPDIGPAFAVESPQSLDSWVQGNS